MNKEEAREIIVLDVPTKTITDDLISRLDQIVGTRDDTIQEPLMDDRLIDIYIFTGIIVATVVITLCRSFLFFSVSII